jgi:predicted nucleic acid-binding Zn ribbon protein
VSEHKPGARKSAAAGAVPPQSPQKKQGPRKGAQQGAAPDTKPESSQGGPHAPAQAPGPDGTSGVDLARVALRAAKEQARARGAAAVQKKQARRGGLRSGARADGRDPLPLGAAISRLITERGWEAPAAVGGVMGRWPQLVGPEVAQHCAPDRYDEDERVLTVQCDSTAWATQLRLLAPTLVARLNADLGHGTVKLLKVLAPAGPSRSYGRLRAPGSRGPGDTYG